MSDSKHNDSALDAQLRAVPVPESLIARLLEISSLSDEQLDLQLRDVAVPSGLTARLSEIPEYTDAEIDSQLRDVPLPVGLIGRLRTPLRRSRRLQPWQAAMAASVLLAAGLSYMAVQRTLQPDQNVAQKPSTPNAGARQPDLEFAPDLNPRALAAADEASSELDIPPYRDGFELPAVDPRDRPRPDLGPVAKLLETFNSTDPALDVTIAEQGLLFGAEGSFDELRDLEVVEGLANPGISPPRVRNYDHLFQQRHGVHPFVDPSAHEALRRSQVPLVTDTAGYDRLWHAVSSGELPPSGSVRIEEILAALDYAFPLPTEHALGIRTAAGPSVFSQPGVSLLQVGVQAGTIVRNVDDAAHLTIGVDISGSMRSAGRLAIVRRALESFVRKLGPNDRISIVGFSGRAEVLLENAGPQDIAAALAVIDSLEPHGSTNLGEGFQVSAAVAIRVPLPQQMSRRVVVLTDGLAALDGGTMRGIEEVVADAAAQGTEIHVIDLGQHAVLDEQLAGFAKAGGGLVRRAASSAQIQLRLLEVLAGRSQLLAQGARLEVEFNPKSVASYRVIGHEASAGAGLLGREVAVELHAGQAATALYEVVLKPEGPDDVALAKVSWRDPATGAERRLTQRISRLQFATSFVGSPISLQLAALASEAAQIFKQSYFTTAGSHSLDRVLELALSANPQVHQQPSFRQLVGLIETARKARQRTPPTLMREQLDDGAGTEN